MSYTIAAVAKRTGIGIHTLRYYDKEGLLPFVARKSSGIRDFEESDIRWITLITCLKKTGMPIKNIKEFIDWYIEGDATIKKRLDMFYDQKKALEAKMAELDDCMNTINNKIWYYQVALDAGTIAVHNKTMKESGVPEKVS